MASSNIIRSLATEFVVEIRVIAKRRLANLSPSYYVLGVLIGLFAAPGEPRSIVFWHGINFPNRNVEVVPWWKLAIWFLVYFLIMILGQLMGALLVSSTPEESWLGRMFDAWADWLIETEPSMEHGCGLLKAVVVELLGPWPPSPAPAIRLVHWLKTLPPFTVRTPIDASALEPKCQICDDLRQHASIDSREICMDDMTSEVRAACQICATLHSTITHIGLLGVIPGWQHAILSILLRSKTIEVYSEDCERIAQDIRLYSTEPRCEGIVSPPQASLSDTRSELSIQRILAWIEICVTRHTNCPSAMTGTLPDRVLDVGEDDSSPVSLYLSNNETAKYACLSHTWGKSMLIRTTRQNLQQYSHQVPWNDLSKLLQDVIEVCRRLSIRYLWVDTLCIIQDSHEDWEGQAAKMADIYEGAFLTISAPSSPSHDAGLHATSEPPYTFYNLPAASVGHGQSHDISIVLGSRNPYDHRPLLDMLRSDGYIPHWTSVGWSNLSVFFPAFERAWIYQERLMSPRILHFSSHELIWECREEVACDCGATHDVAPNGDIEFRRLVGNLSRPIFGKDRELYELWHTIVEKYSQLTKNLTYQSDVFPALSGIAKRFAFLADDQYIAGLWRRDLIAGLMWES